MRYFSELRDTVNRMQQGEAVLKKTGSTARSKVHSLPGRHGNRAVAQMLAAEESRPIPSSFVLVWGDIAVAQLDEVEGVAAMKARRDEPIIKSGGTTNLVPGKVTVRYKAREDDPILDWRRQVVDSSGAQRNIAIVVYDANGKEVTRFNFHNAQPVKYGRSTLTSAATVTVTIEHQGMVAENR
jgi:phage tail-like protein